MWNETFKDNFIVVAMQEEKIAQFLRGDVQTHSPHPKKDTLGV